jgi:AraC-like DNA-binding protein
MEPFPIFVRHAPRSPLGEFVETLWHCAGYVPKHGRERRLPSGVVELVINLRDDTMRVYDQDHRDGFRCVRGSVLCGPQARHIILDTRCQESAIGVQFKPGGAAPFFGLPTRELSDVQVPLADIWGAAADDLRQQLLEARTPQARLALLETTLLQHVVRPLERHPAVAVALRAFQNGPCRASIAQVVNKTGFSQRRFIQVFRDEVGLTPKLFCRLLRFQDALCHTDEKRKLDWTGVALSCGYFDQAHLIRDFQEFAGLSPTAYVAQRGEHRNHVPLVD